MVINLSNSDTLTIYEMNNRETDPYLTSPDTRLLITRQGHPVYRFALKNLHISKGDDPEWGLDAVAMNVANLCSSDAYLTYLVLQAGNSGGDYVALQPSGDSYKLFSISDAMQGRLILSSSNPNSVEVWDAAEPGACTACPKHFFVKSMEFDGARFRLISKIRTKRQYSGFQENPLVVKP